MHIDGQLLRQLPDGRELIPWLPLPAGDQPDALAVELFYQGFA
jgi:hypothetical protein